MYSFCCALDKIHFGQFFFFFFLSKDEVETFELHVADRALNNQPQKNIYSSTEFDEKKRKRVKIK